MFLGIEIGGTKLQLGVGAGTGHPFDALERLDIDSSRGARGILDQIESAATKLLNQHDIKRVGFGFGGPVDAASGRVVTSHQVEGWNDFPLVEWCQDRLGRPAVIGNDCDVAALAEARFGAGRCRDAVFFVTVGTGVGGGLVIEGKLYGADRPAAAEIGHLRPGLDCVDSHSTVESLASGRGIETVAAERIEAARSTESEDANELLRACDGDTRSLTTRMVAQAAATNNQLARDVLNQACRVLGWAIAQVIGLLAVEVVVVGGGVSLIGEQDFFVPLRREVERYVFPPLAGSYEIVPAALGEQVVVHGALALAAAHEEQR